MLKDVLCALGVIVAVIGSLAIFVRWYNTLPYETTHEGFMYAVKVFLGIITCLLLGGIVFCVLSDWVETSKRKCKCNLK